MNFEKLRKALKSHNHIRDRKEKITPYKCLDCGKFYYNLNIGFDNSTVLFLFGVVLGAALILEKFVTITESNAQAILTIILPLCGIGFLLAGIFATTFNILDIKNTDKSRLTDKKLKLDYYLSFGLVVLGLLAMIGGILFFYIAYMVGLME